MKSNPSESFRKNAMDSKLNGRFDRRRFIQTSAGLAGSLIVPTSGFSAEKPDTKEVFGKAKSCIFLWLGGGAAQIDTFDPKKQGDLKKKAGSAYKSIDTAVSGVQLCEYLPRTAKLMDRCVLIRTLNHRVIDEHAAATNIVHTGRPTSETVVYPSIGSTVAHRLGAGSENVPAYILIGYPNISRGPGFLGSSAGYVYLTDTKAGPAGLSAPKDLSSDRRRRREMLLVPRAILHWPTMSMSAARLSDWQAMNSGEFSTSRQSLIPFVLLTAANSASGACWPVVWSSQAFALWKFLTT
jgi:hypothetical protein